MRPMTPWHTSELAEGKRALRRAERHWRRSGLTVHRQICTDLRNTFRKALRMTRSQYYRSEFMEAGGNMRQIYKVANTLLGRDGNRTFPEGSNAKDTCY